MIGTQPLALCSANKGDALLSGGSLRICGYLLVMILTPSLNGRAKTSTLESWRIYSLNSLMASAISSFTPPEQYVLPCNICCHLSHESPWSNLSRAPSRHETTPSLVAVRHVSNVPMLAYRLDMPAIQDVCTDRKRHFGWLAVACMRMYSGRSP